MNAKTLANIELNKERITHYEQANTYLQAITGRVRVYFSAIILDCPFCGSFHSHGAGFAEQVFESGLTRCPHCSKHKSNEQYLLNYVGGLKPRRFDGKMDYWHRKYILPNLTPEEYVNKYK